MKRIALIFALLSATPAWATDLVLELDTLNEAANMPQAVVRVTNHGKTAWSVVKAQCAFMKDGKAVWVDDGRLENVGPGETVYGRVIMLKEGAKVDAAQCRISEKRK